MGYVASSFYGHINIPTLAAVETIWDAGTSVVVPIVAILFFKSTLNLKAGIGILLTIIGIVLIAMGGLENAKQGTKS